MSSRVLRAGIRSSEAVNSLHDKTYRLWTHLLLAADDYGLVELGYGAIRECAPLQTWDKETVAKMLGELTDAGLVLPYQVNGVPYGALAKFQAKINSLKPRCPIPSWALSHCIKPFGFKDKATRIAASKLLEHLDLSTLDDSGALEDNPGITSGTTSVSPVPTTSGALVPEGVRGKGLGDKAKAKTAPPRGSRLPQGWALPDDWEAWALDEAKAKGKPVQPSTVSEWALQFRDYWHSVPGSKGIKLDWQATWRNAVRDLYLPKVTPAHHAGNGQANPFRGGI